MMRRYTLWVKSYIPDSVRMHRIKVLTCFLKAGLPLNKIDYFRDLLEETSYRLSSSRHLADMIPIVRQQEAEKLLIEITGKSISMVLDGTTHVCEAMVIIIRYVDDYWCIKQRVAKIMLLAKALYYWCNHRLELQRKHSLFFLTGFLTNRHIHCKITLRHLSCFSTMSKIIPISVSVCIYNCIRL